jgi:hypothetical protein
MPHLLNACTQSRSVCRSMPPTRAAACRLMPSQIAASEQSTRLVGVATCCSSLPQLFGTHPTLSETATMPRLPESVRSRVTASQAQRMRNPPRLIELSLLRRQFPVSRSHETSAANYFRGAVLISPCPAVHTTVSCRCQPGRPKGHLKRYRARGRRRWWSRIMCVNSSPTPLPYKRSANAVLQP